MSASDDVIRRVMPDASESGLPDAELRAVNGWLRGKPIHTPATEPAAAPTDEVAMLRAEIAALHKNQIEILEMVREIIIKDVPRWIDTKCERIEHRLRAHVAEKHGEVLGRLDGMLANVEARAMRKLHERAFKFAGEPRDGEDSGENPDWRKPDVSKVN
jgi:hypothetical protein